jgi:hypothetical protein
MSRSSLDEAIQRASAAVDRAVAAVADAIGAETFLDEAGVLRIREQPSPPTRPRLTLIQEGREG